MKQVLGEFRRRRKQFASIVFSHMLLGGINFVGALHADSEKRDVLVVEENIGSIASDTSSSADVLTFEEFAEIADSPQIYLCFNDRVKDFSSMLSAVVEGKVPLALSRCNERISAGKQTVLLKDILAAVD